MELIGFPGQEMDQTERRDGQKHPKYETSPVREGFPEFWFQKSLRSLFCGLFNTISSQKQCGAAAAAAAGAGQA